MRTIDADALCAEIIHRLGISDEKYLLDSEKTIFQMIKDAPTIEPKIIHCQGCKYARENKGEPWICTNPDNNAWRITKEFYCGRAERWEDAQQRR